MKILGFPAFLLILSGAAKTLAGIACEAENIIGFCVNVRISPPALVDYLCPYPEYDLYIDEGSDCPNENDVLPENKCSDSA